MAQLGKYTRLLLDSYLVTSDTSDIELSMTRGETETPTHETPTKFLLNEATNELTINGYISLLPNAFVLEKRLNAIFNDPDGTHYMALIPDYRIGSGWDPSYVGTVQSSKMEIKAVSNSVVTISGTLKLLSLSRPGLGDSFEDLRANCIYYEDLKALTAATPVFGTYTDLVSVPDKINVVVFTWEKSGVGAITWNLEESAGGEGSGSEVFTEDEALGTAAAVDSAVSSSIAQQYIRFSIASAATETCGIAAFIQTYTAPA
jgi:hypothetical protein